MRQVIATRRMKNGAGTERFGHLAKHRQEFEDVYIG